MIGDGCGNCIANAPQRCEWHDGEHDVMVRIVAKLRHALRSKPDGAAATVARVWAVVSELEGM